MLKSAKQISFCFETTWRRLLQTWMLLASLIVTTSCAEQAMSDNPKDRFGIVTQDGFVLAVVRGSAYGLTNANLTWLIRKGMAEAYPVQCGVPPDQSIFRQKMFWQVTDGGARPTISIISIRVVQDDRVIKQAFTTAPGPNTTPDAVFIHAVSRLARQVLPPAAMSVGRS